MAAVKAFTPVSRILFIVIYMIAATGLVIRVFRQNEINYVHIFELHYEHKLTEWQLWRVASAMLFFWTFSFNLNFVLLLNSGPEVVAELGVDKSQLEISYGIEVDWISLVTVLVFLIMCIQPFFNCFYRTARGELLYTIYQIVRAPFGKVRFRDFFFADIITSMGHPLVDIGYTLFYFFDGDFLKRNGEIDDSKGFMFHFTLIVAFLPHWFRFWQCIHKWFMASNKMQFINSCKYLCKFGPPLAFYLGAAKKVDVDASFWFYFVAQMINTLFSLYWDFRWDWGMFIGTKRTTRFLRDQTKFSSKFYYFAMATNLIFRFWWIISIFTISFSG